MLAVVAAAAGALCADLPPRPDARQASAPRPAPAGNPMAPDTQRGLGSVQAALCAYMGAECIEGVSCEACAKSTTHEKTLALKVLQGINLLPF